MYKILTKEMLTPAICRMKIEAPLLSSSALPGQFLIVRTHEKGERIPLTISDYDTKDGSVTIVIQVIGASTREMVDSYEAGDYFTDVTGPLGRPSEFTEMPNQELSGQRYIFIAGGLGTAPVYPQARWLHSKGIPVDVIIGAKTSSMLIYMEELKSVCDNLFICTDDGSEGFHGLVTGLLEKLVNEDGRQYTQAVAIGPMIMMKFATLTAIKLGLPITVSMNTLMVDGTGMCGACRVTVGGKVKFACVDGSEFDGAEVDFDSALQRLGQYRLEESKEYNLGRTADGK